MNVILKRLIPEDDKHTIIEAKTRVEVIPDCLMTFKIPCNKKLSPCKLYFKYLSQSVTQDLEVYVSLDEPIPTQKKCDLQGSQPNCLTVLEKNNKLTFKGFQIYVSFYSLEGISLMINPMFKSIQARIRSTTLPKTLINLDDHEELRPQDNPFYEYYQKLKN